MLQQMRALARAAALGAALRRSAAASASAAAGAAEAAAAAARGASWQAARRSGGACEPPLAARALLQPPRRGFAAAATEAPAAVAPSPLMQTPPPLGAPGAVSAAGPAGPPRTAQAVLKGYRMSPKKLNAVAQLVRGLSVDEALSQCALLPKRGARIVERVLGAARANAAHNHGLEARRLVVSRAFVGKGTYLRRIMFHARGKSGVMHRPHAHLTVVLSEAPLARVAAGRLSRRVARPAERDDAPPAWQRHRERRAARVARLAAAATPGAPAARLAQARVTRAQAAP